MCWCGYRFNKFRIILDSKLALPCCDLEYEAAFPVSTFRQLPQTQSHEYNFSTTSMLNHFYSLHSAILTFRTCYYSCEYVFCGFHSILNTKIHLKLLKMVHNNTLSKVTSSFNKLIFSFQPKTKKKFIDKKTSVTFHLVHRSQQDPLITDETAPQHVLLQAGASPQSQSRKVRKIRQSLPHISSFNMPYIF